MPESVYRVIQGVPGQWYVEYICPTSGEVLTAIFIGAESAQRARDYADWRNGRLFVEMVTGR
jgi:hypothetical protein